LKAEPHLWKWVLVALHSAAQGFMVLALWKGNGLLALRPKIAARWLDAYRKGGPYPSEKLDEFMNLYAKVKDKKLLHKPFVPGTTHDKSVSQLNWHRNGFVHFSPQGWSMALASLTPMCVDTCDLINWLGWDSEAVLWFKLVYRNRARRALRPLRRNLRDLAALYQRRLSPQSSGGATARRSP
jgi:hypothetical protein